MYAPYGTAFQVGARIRLSYITNPTYYSDGYIFAYSGTLLTMFCETSTFPPGTYSGFNFSIVGAIGPSGPAGPAGPTGAGSGTSLIFKSWDGQGSFISSGNPRYHVMSTNGTITGWSILAVGTGATASIDIWRVTYGTSLPTVSNSIVAANYPILATGSVLRSTGVTGWSLGMTAGDILGFNINATGNATLLNFTLEYTIP